MHRRQPLQSLGNRLRLPWQVDDERAATDHRHLARKDCGRNEVQRDLPHLLTKTRHHLVRHSQRGFRCHVTQRRPGAASGQYQMAVHFVS